MSRISKVSWIVHGKLAQPLAYIYFGRGDVIMANVLAVAVAVAGPNSKYILPDAQPAGFWAGFWHGLIVPITFIISIFNPNVRIYETSNRGRLYDFGFILGLTGSFGGSGSRTRLIDINL